MSIDLRLGRYQDVLQDVTCDCLIVDAPYSERTHSAHSPRTDVLTACKRDARWAAKGGQRSQIAYSHWSADDVASFCAFWADRTRGWMVSITDNVLAPAWEKAIAESGRYVFAPLSFVAPGSRVRLAGDGPSQWSCWIVVGRPKTKPYSKWGTLPGAYVLPPGQESEQYVTGGKPLWLMRALVRDYSRPGDVVCDPCAGAGTTLLAAAIEGRKTIGAEMDPKTHAIAKKRSLRGFTPTLFPELP